MVDADAPIADRPGSDGPSPGPDALQPVRLGPHALASGVWSALATGAVFARADVAVLSLAGPGAVLCAQGLLTTDIEKAGEDAFLYGALLTPKGMIVLDGWAARRGAQVTYTTPADLGARGLALLRRALPPRLARASEVSGDVAVFRLAGPRALASASAAGLPVPASAGSLALGPAGEASWEVARASERAPFALQLTVPVREAELMAARLVAAGVVSADGLALEAARIMTGWPRVGTEVDHKTLPQEVRFDELGGVSYTKGCYTGQETVSRLHFRGHPNRVLLGLRFDEEPEEGGYDVTRADRGVGRVSSLLWMPHAGRDERAAWVGLAVLRREVEPGAVVRAAGRDARVVGLPFGWPGLPS